MVPWLHTSPIHQQVWYQLYVLTAWIPVFCQRFFQPPPQCQRMLSKTFQPLPPGSISRNVIKENMNISLLIFSQNMTDAISIQLINSSTWYITVNSLLAGDATWRHSAGSTFVQVMTCCLFGTRPYSPNFCWRMISKILCHSPKDNIARRHGPVIWMALHNEGDWWMDTYNHEPVRASDYMYPYTNPPVLCERLSMFFNFTKITLENMWILN